MAVAVVFLPLVAAIIVGFFGRAIGDRGSQLITCGALLLSAVLGVLLFRDILSTEEARVIPLASWIIAGGVDVSWSLRLDTLSGVMIVVVIPPPGISPCESTRGIPVGPTAETAMLRTTCATPTHR